MLKVTKIEVDQNVENQNVKKNVESQKSSKNTFDVLKFFDAIGQRFSTWGRRTPRGTQAGHREYAGSSKSVHKIKKHPK